MYKQNSKFQDIISLLASELESSFIYIGVYYIMLAHLCNSVLLLLLTCCCSFDPSLPLATQAADKEAGGRTKGKKKVRKERAFHLFREISLFYLPRRFSCVFGLGADMLRPPNLFVFLCPFHALFFPALVPFFWQALVLQIGEEETSGSRSVRFQCGGLVVASSAAARFCALVRRRECM